MTYTYKLGAKNTDGSQNILIKETGECIPPCDSNRHYIEYLAWVAEGNTPEAAD
tara:strand:- start:33 stop:194 length:162 start_codon:yes stop_codon:yes gene_type:complete